jgi:Flp pilus assembly protein TadG
MTARLRRCESGTSVIEFALIAPVFVFLLIGLIETGRYTTLAILASHAARAGVQYGGQTVFSAADTIGMKNAALQDGMNLNWTVTPSYFCINNGAVISCPTVPPSTTTYYVQVKVTGTFNSLMHYPGIPASMPITATATMRVQSQ